MNRRIALAIAWGLASWNAIALVGYASGLALGAVAAPVGIIVGLAIALTGNRIRSSSAPARSLKLDADRA